MDIDRQIILIPGIMGSTLHKNMSVQWPGHVHRIFNPSFYDPLGDLNDMTIKPAGAVKQIYEKLEIQLEKYCNTYKVFDYDWRKNNLSHVKDLKQLIKVDADEIIIVAHSMGGIIAKLYLNTLEESILRKIKLITIGTPWKGSPDAYRSLLEGIGIMSPLVITKHESKQVISKFESIYQLLPNKEYVSTHSDERYSFFQKNGKDYTWDNIYNEIYCDFLSRVGYDQKEVLDDFYDAMSIESDFIHHEIIGYDFATVCQFVKNGDEDLQTKYERGDGTVPLNSAVSKNSEQYFVKGEHGKLPKVDLVLNLIKKIIYGEDIIKGTDFLSKEQVNGIQFSFKVFKVACPVTVSILDEEGNTLYGDIGEMTEEQVEKSMFKNSKIQRIGDSVYFIITKDDYGNQLKIEAYDEGPVKISITEYNDNKIEKTGVFKTININDKMNMEIDIDKEVEGCELRVNKMSGETLKIEPIIKGKTEDNNDVTLPETIYKIESKSEKIIKSKDGTYLSEDAKICFEKIKEGTYPILETWLIINLKKYLIEMEEINEIELLEGRNEIEIFTKDIMGNTEESKKSIIHILKSESFTVNLDFFPRDYNLSYTFEYENLYEELGIDIPICYFVDENDKQIESLEIIYEQKDKIMKLIAENIYGCENRNIINFVVPECLVKNIIDGDSNETKVQELLKRFSISEKDLQISYERYDGNNRYSKLTQENINNAYVIKIESKNLSISINKDISYEVVYTKLIEDIQLIEDTSYELKFKVLERDNRSEVKINNMYASLGYKDEDESFKKIYSMYTEYNDDEKVYIATIKVDSLIISLAEYGDFDISDNMCIRIYYIDGTEKILRDRDNAVVRYV